MDFDPGPMASEPKPTRMKLIKISIAAAIAVLALGACTAQANQIVDGTYTFTATDGNTFLDGSWIKFSGDSIVDWYLKDSKINSSTQQYPTTDLPLTPLNSFLASSAVLGVNAWYFTIDGNNIAVNYYDEFKGQNNLFGPGSGGGLGSLYVGFGDPDGNWTMVTSHATTNVPDAASTLPMLAGALTILGTCRNFARRSKK